MTTSIGLTPNIPPLTSLTQKPDVTTDKAAEDPAARKQAEEFEATFISALLKPVFEGLAKNSAFGGGFAEETWTGLLTEEYAKSVSGKANLGIADHVYDQLIKLQETASDKPVAPK